MVKFTSITQPPAIVDQGFSVALHGKGIDDRTNKTLEQISKFSCNSYEVEYSRSNMSIDIGASISLHLRELHELAEHVDCSKAFIDATSLGFVEIIYLIYALSKATTKVSVTICYTTPLVYRSTAPTHPEEEEFDLSDSVLSFTGLPIFTYSHSDSDNNQVSLIALLGFESGRLGKALAQDDNTKFGKMKALIGVPAFNPGWENKSISKHLRHFDQLNTQLHYYSSQNPYQTYEVLSRLYAENEKIVIASLGTKPAALACAAFLVNNFERNSRDKNVSVIYDYPSKKIGRTEGIKEVYYYELSVGGPIAT
ncbi:hypothetical protein KUV89_12985 [Marinobacter hydrocarbonoclasticus]|nr:hypothetical protein [Marinobacter nauticus]